MYGRWMTSLFLDTSITIAEILTVKTGARELNDTQWFLHRKDGEMQLIQFHPMYERQIANCHRWASLFPQLRDLEISIFIALPYGDEFVGQINNRRCYEQVLHVIEAGLQNWELSVDVRNISPASKPSQMEVRRVPASNRKSTNLLMRGQDNQEVGGYDREEDLRWRNGSRRAMTWTSELSIRATQRWTARSR
jgi:hypothetical protein